MIRDPFRFYQVPPPAPTYFGGTLPEVMVSSDEVPYPYYNQLTPEERSFFNDEGSIGRGVRSIAMTGKRGQTYSDLSRVAKDAESFAAEMTGIPGSIRFAQDPVKKLKGAGRTIEATILGSSPFIASPYNQEDVADTFDALDAFGFATLAFAPLKTPLQQGIKSSGRYLTRGYGNLSTGNSFIPRAWRSPIENIDQPMSQKFFSVGNIFKKKPLQDLFTSHSADFSKYLTQKEAVAARAERLLSQKHKKGWNEQLTPELEEKLSNAVQRHDPASDYSGSSLGRNKPGRSGTEVSKNAYHKETGLPLTDAQKSMIAAHETGHYYSNSLKEGMDWKKYFNFSDLPYKTRKYLKGKSNYNNFGNEIRERAAQLKDFIAYKNKIPLNQDFKITRTQLDDALENYVKETGLDNEMTPFIEALKKKGNISGFLKEMNKRPLVYLSPTIGVGAYEANQMQDAQPTMQEYKLGGYIPSPAPTYFGKYYKDNNK